MVQVSNVQWTDGNVTENGQRALSHEDLLTMGQILTRLLEIFYSKKLDIVVIGLENR